MAFDFKKEYRELYLPTEGPRLVRVPEMAFIAVDGTGDPNEPGGEFGRAAGVLYAVAYTLRMSARSGHAISGFFDYVVPPLEGWWQQESAAGGIDYARKDRFRWTAAIRAPDFVSAEDAEWAKAAAARKKGLDCSHVEFLRFKEGLCVQALHVGPYDDEPRTIRLMEDYMAAEGYEADVSERRRHHEIYLSNARRVPPERWRTVIRLPARAR